MKLEKLKQIIWFIENNIDGTPSNEYFLNSKEYFLKHAKLPEDFLEIMKQGEKILDSKKTEFTPEECKILRMQRAIIAKCRYAFMSLILNYIDNIRYAARALELNYDNYDERQLDLLHWNEIGVFHNHLERLAIKAQKIQYRLIYRLPE